MGARRQPSPNCWGPSRDRSAARIRSNDGHIEHMSGCGRTAQIIIPLILIVEMQIPNGQSHPGR
jgi:hypothetical protein